MLKTLFCVSDICAVCLVIIISFNKWPVIETHLSRAQVFAHIQYKFFVHVSAYRFSRARDNSFIKAHGGSYFESPCVIKCKTRHVINSSLRYAVSNSFFFVFFFSHYDLIGRDYFLNFASKRTCKKKHTISKKKRHFSRIFFFFFCFELYFTARVNLAIAVFARHTSTFAASRRRANSTFRTRGKGESERGSLTAQLIFRSVSLIDDRDVRLSSDENPRIIRRIKKRFRRYARAFIHGVTFRQMARRTIGPPEIDATYPSDAVCARADSSRASTVKHRIYTIYRNARCH